MTAFVLAAFFSAFLLFQVQPIIARYILPWYGGAPAVWTTCLLFFQVALLCGYSYAYILVKNVAPARQPVVHLILLTAALFLLPITPSDAWIPTGVEQPALTILLLLSTSIGVPFVLISASAPLLQQWFASANPGKSPYRLYALSNLGSLVALLTYPVIVEPALTLESQTNLWSIGFAVFTVLCAWCALPLLRDRLGYQHGEKAPANQSAPIHRRDRTIWVLLTACGSTVLLATTNQMCQDVAVIPFLWVLPLSLYLLSFIITFENDKWYRRSIWIPFLLVTSGLLVNLLQQDYAGGEMLLLYQIAIYCSAMFACCMVCHGELVRRRPAVSHLTSFYLYVALGGALGGVFVNFMAPLLFTGFWELHGSLAATFILAGFCILYDKQAFTSLRLRSTFGAVWILVVAALAISLTTHIREQRDDALLNTRNFFGVLHVYEWNSGTSRHQRAFYHGRIHHGSQWLEGQRRSLPSTYYGVDSGIAAAFEHHPKRRRTEEGDQGLNVGVVGLGVGAISVHASDADSLRFYEINPQVERIARDYFTFMSQGSADKDVVLGDGRVSLERELDEEGSMEFDILVLDAFSGDSVPVHLLTYEAFELYWQHLRTDGILAVNITNLHLDLSDVVRQLAKRFGKDALWFVDEGRRQYESHNVWVLVTDNAKFIESERVRDLRVEWIAPEPKPILWTDKFSNLFQVIRWQ